MSAVAAAFFESSHGDVIVNWVKTKVDTGDGGNAALAQAILAYALNRSLGQFHCGSSAVAPPRHRSAVGMMRQHGPDFGRRIIPFAVKT